MADRYCRYCGTPTSGERFCSECGRPAEAERPEEAAVLVEAPNPRLLQEEGPATPANAAAVLSGTALCINCGSPVHAGKRFCNQCGQPIGDATVVRYKERCVRCVCCGSPLRAGEQFCMQCGEPIAQTPASTRFSVLKETVGEASIELPHTVDGPQPAAKMQVPESAAELIETPALLSLEEDRAVASAVAAVNIAETAPSVTVTCAECGSPVRAGKRFCTQCGEPIVQTSVPAETSGPISRHASVQQTSVLPEAIGEVSTEPPPVVDASGSSEKIQAPEVAAVLIGAPTLLVPHEDRPAVSAVAAVIADPAAPLMMTTDTCSECGSPLRADERFCTQCGKPIIQTSVPTEPAALPETIGETAIEPPQTVDAPEPAAKTQAENAAELVETLALLSLQEDRPAASTVAAVNGETAPWMTTGTSCPKCGLPVRAGKRFCTRCGEPIIQTPTPTETASTISGNEVRPGVPEAVVGGSIELPPPVDALPAVLVEAALLEDSLAAEELIDDTEPLMMVQTFVPTETASTISGHEVRPVVEEGIGEVPVEFPPPADAPELAVKTRVPEAAAVLVEAPAARTADANDFAGSESRNMNAAEPFAELTVEVSPNADVPIAVEEVKVPEDSPAETSASAVDPEPTASPDIVRAPATTVGDPSSVFLAPDLPIQKRSSHLTVLSAVACILIIVMVGIWLHTSHAKPVPRVPPLPVGTASQNDGTAVSGKPSAVKPSGEELVAPRHLEKETKQSVTPAHVKGPVIRQPEQVTRSSVEKTSGKCELLPSDISSYLDRADTARGAGRYDDAARQYNKVIVCDSRNPRAQQGLARTRQARAVSGRDSEDTK